MAKDKPLTAKENNFCENVGIKDMTYSDAVRDAYDYDNASMETINVQGSKLMSIPKIALRVAELREQMKDKVIKKEIYTREKHIQDLQKLIDIALGKDKDIILDKIEINSAIKATELMGKTSELYNFIQKAEVKTVEFKTPTQERIEDLAKKQNVK